MTRLPHRFLLACAGLLLGGAALAQPGPGMGMGRDGGMGPGASATERPCMKADAGRGPNCDWRPTRRNSPGFALMTPEERVAHRDRMRGFQSREECLAYVTEHHAQISERAKAKGQTLPAPRHRLCDRLPSAR